MLYFSVTFDVIKLMAKKIKGKKGSGKIVGYKTVHTPETVSKGHSKVNLHFKSGHTKTSYKPTSVETGHSAYGKPGGGTNSEMNALLHEARKNKQDVTRPNSKGLTFKAGETTTIKKPDLISSKIDIKPTLTKVTSKQVPIYEQGALKSSGKSGGKLKARRVVVGGSDKSGNPATKVGVGGKKKLRIRKVTSHKKY
jgi:hypothetical protein